MQFYGTECESATMLVRNKTGDWAGRMEEQFRALHGGQAPSREWRKQMEGLGPLAATAEEANTERWPMAAGHVAAGTYQVISGATLANMARCYGRALRP